MYRFVGVEGKSLLEGADDYPSTLADGLGGNCPLVRHCRFLDKRPNDDHTVPLHPAAADHQMVIIDVSTAVQPHSPTASLKQTKPTASPNIDHVI